MVLELPLDLQERVLSFLYCDVQNLSQVCQGWSELICSESLWAEWFERAWGSSESNCKLLFMPSWRDKFRRKLAGVLMCRECKQGKVGERSAGLLIRPCFCSGLVHRWCLDKQRARSAPLSGLLAWWRARYRHADLQEIQVAEDGNPTALIVLQEENGRNINRVDDIALLNDLNDNNTSITHCHSCQFRYLIKSRYPEGHFSWDKARWVGRLLGEVMIATVLSTLVTALSGWASLAARDRSNKLSIPYCSILSWRTLGVGLGRVADVVGIATRIATIFLGSSDARDMDFYDDHRGLGLCMIGVAIYIGARSAVMRHTKYYRHLLISRMQVCDRGR